MPLGRSCGDDSGTSTAVQISKMKRDHATGKTATEGNSLEPGLPDATAIDASSEVAVAPRECESRTGLPADIGDSRARSLGTVATGDRIGKW